jgi:hypothetical protein
MRSFPGWELAFLPMIAMVVVAANLSNVVLLPRLGPKPLVTAGMLLAAGSLVWLTRIGAGSGYASAVLGPLMVAGLGLGFTIAPSMNTGTFDVAPQDVGVASATLNTGQQVGGSIGTSLLNTIFASAVAHYLTSHLSPASHDWTHDGVRASGARLDPPNVLRHRLPPLVHLHNARRRRHRGHQRCPGSSQLTARDAPGTGDLHPAHGRQIRTHPVMYLRAPAWLWIGIASC